MDFKLIQICSEYAAIAHNGQYRKNKITPYFSHPARVSNYVSIYLPNDSISIAAGYTHDVLEDCLLGDGYKIQNGLTPFDEFLLDNKDIRKKDGEKIFRIVKELTCDNSFPKNERKLKYYTKLKDEGLVESCIIKFCDRIDNLQTVDSFTKKGREWYLEDTQVMLDILNDKCNYIEYNNAWKDLKQELEKKK